MMDFVEIEIYETDAGRSPYIEWEKRLTAAVRGVVRRRLNRVRLGNFGDAKLIKGTRWVYELRIHHGPGYRVYFGKQGKRMVLLLCGGDKGSQSRDIKRAVMLWQEYLVTRR